MDATPSSVVCELSYQLSKNLTLRLIILSKVVVSLLGIGCCLLFLKIKGVRWLVHPNAKVLFCFHVAFTILVCTGFAFNYAYDFNRLSSTSSDPCYFAMPFPFVFHSRIISIGFLYSQTYTMFGFAVERAISTVYLEKYERIKKPYLGIGIGLLALVLGVGGEYAWLAPGLKWNTFVPTYSLRTVDNAIRFRINLYSQLAILFCTIIIFWATLILNNEKQKRHKLTLSPKLGNKYQVVENQRVIRSLLPCFVVHFAISTMSSLGMAMYPLFFETWDPVSYAQWVESFNQPHMYSVIMPIVLYCRLKSMEQRVEVDRNLSSDAYFRTFNLFINQT